MSNWNVRFVKDKNYIFLKYEDFVKDPKSCIDQILEKLEVEKVDVISLYQQVHHGKIAEGDSWNKPIEQKARDEKVLSFKDKMIINLVCYPYFKKYQYK